MTSKHLCKPIGLSVVLSLTLQLLLAQNREITGKVIDSKEKSAISNVSVIAKGTQTGTQTDSAGNFRLIIPLSVKTLTISAIGFLSRDIDVSKTNFIEVGLVSTALSLNKVIVIGYGTLQSKDVTGAVDKVTSDEFNKGIITNPMQQLQGKVAGLVIVQPGGDPNGEFTVRLRGATSIEGQPPLLVIDGVAMDDFNKGLAALNPSDVESFDVLKDASAAAIYGTRGANGVILITTKKGRVGKIMTEYSGFVAMEKISHQLSVLSADEWRKATAGMNANGLDAGANTDWQKAIEQTGFSQSHTIAVSGATNQLNIRGSIGYIRQQGVVLNSGKETVTGRLTAFQKSLKNKLETSYGINVSSTKRDLLWDQGSTDQSRFGGSYIFGFTPHCLPVWPAYNPDGSYYLFPNSSFNPLFVLNEIYSKRKDNFFLGSFKADYELVKGLKLGALTALSKGNDVYDNFSPPLPGTTGPAQATKVNYNKENFSGDIHGNYHRSFDKHTMDFTGVYEYNKYENDDFGVTARGFLVYSLLNNNLGAATNITPGDIFSHKTEVKLISFLGRMIYKYNDRYILTVNFRRDGSSKFGPDNRWGNFPSAALAWRMSDERFLQRLKWLGNLKLRVSYGLTGNQESLPPYSYQLLYGPSAPYLSPNGSFSQSYAVTQEYNPDLKWEVRKSFNAGVDFSVFDNRINGTVDFFNDHTDDMLFRYDIPQPPFLTNNVYANAASAINKGVEITVNAAIIKTKEITWEVQPVVATLKNHITKLLGQFKGVKLSLNDPSYGYSFGVPVSVLKIGYPTGVFWLPQHAGLDANGHELYNNYDATGKFTGTSTSFTDKDKVFIDPTPKFTWALTNNFRFGNFDFDFLLRGVQGQKIFSNTLLGIESVQYLPGSNVTHNALTNGLADFSQPSTYWLKNGSYARLENVTVGYSFKSLKGCDHLHFYITATNVFMITRYEGIDPEIRTEGNERYIDFNYYPKSRGFTFGLDIGF